MSKVRNTGGTVRSIWQRDKRRCWICGHAVAIGDASRDHVEPRFDGGYDKASNYRLAHRRCNTARGRLSPATVKRIQDELGHYSAEQMCQALMHANRVSKRRTWPSQAKSAVGSR